MKKPHGNKGKTGRVPWNKGIKGLWTISEEHKQALRNANIGRKPWNAGLKYSPELRKKLSDGHEKGKASWNKGIPQTLEVRNKIGESVRKRFSTEEAKTKLRARPKRTPFKGHHHTSETRKNISDHCPWKGKHISEEVRKNISEGRKKKGLGKWQTAPTKPELRIIKLIQEYKLPFIYTGLRKSLKDYNVIENLRCSPDFIATNKKFAIEAFGKFWHTNSKYLPNIEEKDERKRKHFEKIGWQRLVIWDDEMEKMKDEEIVNRILENYNNCQQFRECINS